MGLGYACTTHSATGRRALATCQRQDDSPRLGRSIIERIHVPTPFTAKQGQYLAFIYYYSKIHGIPPAEADFRRFFRVTPPVVHQMIKTLHAHGFIDREPGKARSIRLRLTRAELPDLD
jgi:DNA-binding MarR family transcriptional regulator